MIGNELVVNGLRLLFKPSVFLIGHTAIDEAGLADFLESEGVPEWSTDSELPAQILPEVAGRVCYLSYAKPRPGGNRAYLNNIIETGHHSVLEHTQWTFAVTGVSRSLSHELVRHRHTSPSQLSQRYVDESACRFVVPPFMQKEVADWVADYLGGRVEWSADIDCSLAQSWLDSLILARETYGTLTERLLEKVQAEYPDLSKTDARKMARQTARSVLPNATETKLVITGNARAWRHFIGLRASVHAEDEIRLLALAIFEQLKATAPTIFGDFTRRETSGKVELVTDNIF